MSKLSIERLQTNAMFYHPHQNNNYERTYKTDNKQPDQIALYSQIWVYTASSGMFRDAWGVVWSGYTLFGTYLAHFR